MVCGSGNGLPLSYVVSNLLDSGVATRLCELRLSPMHKLLSYGYGMLGIRWVLPSSVVQVRPNVRLLVNGLITGRQLGSA